VGKRRIKELEASEHDEVKDLPMKDRPEWVFPKRHPLFVIGFASCLIGANQVQYGPLSRIIALTLFAGGIILTFSVDYYVNRAHPLARNPFLWIGYACLFMGGVVSPFFLWSAGGSRNVAIALDILGVALWFIVTKKR
jgi:hypothetical protein